MRRSGRKVNCHYCGARLNGARNSDGDRKITCSKCLADNHFDARGNLIDVPVEEVGGQPGIGIDNQIASESSTFCSTCLKNQYLYVQALSDYLPEDDDPNYQELEESLPKYKEELALRYPQCCRVCEPRVREQINQANYTAKADHLRRVLHRKAHRRRDFRQLIVFTAGCGYATSLFLQLAWHALASQADSTSITPDLSIQQCLQQWPVPRQCSERLAGYIPISLALGMVCSWWTPKWQYKLAGGNGRLKGLDSCLYAQVGLIILRFAAWVLLVDLPGIENYSKVLHLLAFLLISIFTVRMYTLVQVDDTPLVDWNKPQASLIVEGQFENPVAPYLRGGTDQRPFSISDLSGPTQSQCEPWRPPTPPIDTDSMDWKPDYMALDARPRLAKPKFEQKSPFYGALPAAPTRGSLNPKARSSPQQKKALGIAPGFFGLSKTNSSSHNQKSSQYTIEDAFAPAKLHLLGADDTGLEGLFDNVFSVHDSPRVPGKATAKQQINQEVSDDPPSYRHTAATDDADMTEATNPPEQSIQPSIMRSVWNIVATASLFFLAGGAVAVELWLGAAETPSTTLPWAVLAPLFQMADSLVRNAPSFPWLVTQFLLILSYAFLWSTTPTPDSSFIPIWNKSITGLTVLVLCLQFGYTIYYLQRLGSVPRTPYRSSSIKTRQQGQSGRGRDSKAYMSSPTIAQATTTAAQPFTQYSGEQTFQRLPRANSSFTTIQKRDSNESIGSTVSVATTATQFGQTPRKKDSSSDVGPYDSNPVRGLWDLPDTSNSPAANTRSRHITRGVGGLSLTNDLNSGGFGIAGSRSRY